MNRALKLLFVLPAYEPAWALGGIVRCMSNLCRALAGLGHQVTVYTINTDGRGSLLEVPCGQSVDQGGVAAYYFASTLGPGSFFDSRGLVRHLGKTIRNFDLVYASAIWQWLGLSVAKICAQQQVPLIIGTHGSINQSLQHIRALRRKIFWHFFLRKSFACAAALHFTTLYERRQSADLLGEFKSFVVPNSLDCHYFSPHKNLRQPFRERYGIPADAPLIITVTRAVPTKRIDLLIKSLPAEPAAHLLVVGPEPGDVTRQWQELAAELHVAPRLIWTGYLQGEDLLAAYAAADLFALISAGENFGMVVVEAMACGLPVMLNSEVGVCDEVSGEAGVFMVEQDPDAICNALRHFVDQRPLWDAWQENCRSFSQEVFSHHKVAALMAQACQDVLTGVRTPACRWANSPR